MRFQPPEAMAEPGTRSTRPAFFAYIFYFVYFYKRGADILSGAPKCNHCWHPLGHLMILNLR